MKPETTILDEFDNGGEMGALVGNGRKLKERGSKRLKEYVKRYQGMSVDSKEDGNGGGMVLDLNVSPYLWSQIETQARSHRISAYEWVVAVLLQKLEKSRRCVS